MTGPKVPDYLLERLRAWDVEVVFGYVIQRQLRGNLPHAFVHALLLESAARLARPWGEA